MIGAIKPAGSQGVGGDEILQNEVCPTLKGRGSEGVNEGHPCR